MKNLIWWCRNVLPLPAVFLICILMLGSCYNGSLRHNAPHAYTTGPIILFRTDGELIPLEEEIRKQFPEQLLHASMIAVPITIFGTLTGMPWLGLIVVPIIMAKEADEWPSDRPWDPAIDGFFYGLGLFALLL